MKSVDVAFDFMATTNESLDIQSIHLLWDPDASSAVCDVTRSVVIRKLLYYIFNTLPVFIRWWEIQTHFYGTFLA
jgi:hypothetical protein